jgi:hypothetical protein
MRLAAVRVGFGGFFHQPRAATADLEVLPQAGVNDEHRLWIERELRTYVLELRPTDPTNLIASPKQ